MEPIAALSSISDTLADMFGSHRGLSSLSPGIQTDSLGNHYALMSASPSSSRRLARCTPTGTPIPRIRLSKKARLRLRRTHPTT